ncbi:MAG: single-stranded DNA-binding protein [Desulfitobacteriaceae bacterium]
MNNVQVLGRLTKDPELKYSQNGKAVCQFSIAVNRNKDETDFFDCVAWEKTAETVSNYVKKGQRVLVDGRLQQEKWKDQQSSENRYAVKIIVNRFDFIEAAEQNSNPPQQTPAPAQAPYNQPPMGMPGAYGQPPMQPPIQQPYQGQYPQQHMQPPQGYTQPPAGSPPMQQQQGYWLGENSTTPQVNPGPAPYGNIGYPAPASEYKKIPF